MTLYKKTKDNIFYKNINKIPIWYKLLLNHTKALENKCPDVTKELKSGYLDHVSSICRSMMICVSYPWPCNVRNHPPNVDLQHSNRKCLQISKQQSKRDM